MRYLTTDLLHRGRRLLKGVAFKVRAFTHSETATVILVGGVQRSGTNMLMNLLDRSSEVRVYHDSDPAAYSSYALKAPAEIDGLLRGAGARFVAFKPLLDTHRISDLLNRYEGSRIIWPVRRFDDMINSYLTRWSAETAQIDGIFGHPEIVGWKAAGLEPQALDQARNVYSPTLDAPSRVALFWYLRNSVYFAQGLDKYDNSLLLYYETFVEDPFHWTRFLCHWMGLRYSRRLCAHVHAVSVRKASPPLLHPSVRRLCEAMLERLERASQK